MNINIHVSLIGRKDIHVNLISRSYRMRGNVVRTMIKSMAIIDPLVIIHAKEVKGELWF